MGDWLAMVKQSEEAWASGDVNAAARYFAAAREDAPAGVTLVQMSDGKIMSTALKDGVVTFEDPS